MKPTLGMEPENKASDKPKCEKESSIKSILAEFASSTTAHGCAQINQSQTSSARLIWMAIFVACFIGATICISTLLQKFFQFPTKDVIEVSSDPITFPSISFCSLNPVPSSFPKKIERMNTGNNFINIKRTIHNFDKHVENESFPLYNRLAPMFHRIKSYVWIYENAPGEDETLAIGHDLDDLLLLCTLGMAKCNTTEIRSFSSSVYYKCYTLNAKDFNDSSIEPIVHSTGITGGLTAIFFLDTHDEAKGFYSPTCPVGGSSGVHVVIHPPGTQPDPINSGFDITPGFTTNVELQKNNRELLGYPWGDCENREKLEGFPYKYDKLSCEYECQQRYVMDQCGCVTAFLPVPDDLKNVSMCGKMDLVNLNSASPNLTKISEEIDAMECEAAKWRVLKKDYPAENKCVCPTACHNDVYDYTISQAEWPFGGVQLDFYHHAMKMRDMKGSGYVNSTMYDLLDNKLNTNDTTENRKNKGMIRENFLRLNVFFTSLTTDVTKQVEEYPFTDLISGIGGGFGVYVGFSIVTICEFCVLFAHLIKAILNHRNKAVEDVPNSKIITVKEYKY